MAGGTIIIDDCANGGSDDGAWHTHIAHTPALRAQCPEEFQRAPSTEAPEVVLRGNPSGRNEDARSAVRRSLEAGGSPGGAIVVSPQSHAIVPPGNGEAR